jgi:catechol 2,3-dioxygenase-like lactoylglutathione lyase family enzyme
MTVLFKRHFQVAYVVDDARAAIEILGKRYGVEKWDLMDMAALHGPGASARFIGNAWVGDTMIEVIEPDESVESIYQGWKKDSGAALRFHHLGFLVDSAEEFDAAKAQLAGHGFPIVAGGSFGEVLDFAYADTTAELGHYYEIIRLKAQGDSFFGRIPVN